MFGKFLFTATLITPAIYVMYDSYMTYKKTKQIQGMRFFEYGKRYDEYVSDTNNYIKLNPDLLKIEIDEMDTNKLNNIKNDFMQKFNLTQDDEPDVYFNKVFMEEFSKLQIKDIKENRV